MSSALNIPQPGEPIHPINRRAYMSLHILPSGPADGWNICVMAREETYFANTSHGAIRGFGAIMPGALFDAGALLGHIDRTFEGAPEGLLIVPAMPGGGEHDTSQPDGLAARWGRMVAAAARAGWDASGDQVRAHTTGWVTFRHTSGRELHMGVLGLMDQGRTPLFDITGDAETITNRLVAYATVTGVLWRMTAGVSGCESIRADRAARAQRQLTIAEIGEDPDQGQPHWRWSPPPGLHGAGHMLWARELAPAERHGKIVTYDVRAQFLAAMAGQRYGWGEPRQRTRVPFDPERAGFWLIADSGPLTLDGPPIVRVTNRGLTWVTTPVMVYLVERGIEPMVYDSWTSATSSQFLKPWAQDIRDALYAQSETLREIEPALKRTYSETNGMFNARGGSVDRTDWHWTTVDGGTMNVRRKLDHVHKSIGIWPCEVYHDAVSFPCEDAEMFKALNNALGVKYPVPQGDLIKIGKFKYVRAVTVQAWEAKQASKKGRTLAQEGAN